jgi:amino acid transporter
MLAVAIAGIRLTGRTQIALAVVEYAILGGLAIAGLVYMAGRHHGTVPVTSAWLSPTGIGGQGSLSAGFLISAFVIAGWDGTLYVNEEVRHRRINPGRAAMWAAGLLAVLYTLIQVGLQGTVSPARLQANSSSVLVYTVQQFAGHGWGQVMAVAVALSVIATTGVGIVLTARIMYGMASYRALPPALGNISARFATPVAASIVTAALLLGLIWLYLLGTSLQNACGDLLSVSSWLTIGFYILTVLALMAYYRRRIITSPRDAVTLGLLPLGAVVFLGWVLVRSFAAAIPAQKWSLAAVLAVGVVLMLLARFAWQSPFFHLAREATGRQSTAPPGPSGARGELGGAGLCRKSWRSRPRAETAPPALPGLIPPWRPQPGCMTTGWAARTTSPPTGSPPRPRPRPIRRSAAPRAPTGRSCSGR